MISRGFDNCSPSFLFFCGSVAELVDAHDSKSCILTGVRVRFSPEPPIHFSVTIKSSYKICWVLLRSDSYKSIQSCRVTIRSEIASIFALGWIITTFES